MEKTTQPRRPVFCYTRVSDPSKGERTEATASIPRQRAELRKLAEANGDVVVEVFEEAQTAHEGGRAEYERMMGRLHEVQAVYVVAYDRLTRIPDPSEQEKIRKAFVAAGVDIVTPGHTFRYSDPKFDSPETRLHQRALGMFGAYEWDTIMRRMGKGKKVRAEQGLYYGHPVPFGYAAEFDKQGRKLFPIVEEQAAVVRGVFALYLEGYGGPAIARELRELGVPSPYLRGWSAQQIRAMLCQDIYIGRSTFGSKTRYPRPVANHITDTPIVVDSKVFAPIVDRDTWERAQEQRQARTRRRECVGRVHLLTGILACPGCGASMMSHGTWTKSALPPYYACRRARKAYDAGDSPGHQAFYNMARAHEALHKWLLVRLPKYAEGKHRRKQAAKPRDTEMVDAARRRVADLERRWAGAVELAEMGVLKPDEARVRFAIIRDELAQAKSHLEGLRHAQQPEAPRAMILDGAMAKLAAFDPQAPELREIYVSLLAEVQLKKGAKRGRDIPLSVERVRFVNGEWYPTAPI